MNEISYEDFKKLDIRCGTVVSAENFPEAKNPAYIITVDFGPQIGVKQTSAQITDLYSPDDLIGKQVLGAVNLPSKQIGPVRSEFLVLGFSSKGGEKGRIVLAGPDSEVPNGAKLH